MITVTFKCGHVRQAKGDEQRLRCACGETETVSIKAPAPKFRGHALGPCAQFEDLPAKAVTLKVEDSHGRRN